MVFHMLRLDKRQVLHYNSNVKKIMLKVKVTNSAAPGKLAEDAHQAILNVTIPDTLRYSGVRSEVRPPEGSVHLLLHFHHFCILTPNPDS